MLQVTWLSLTNIIQIKIDTRTIIRATIKIKIQTNTGNSLMDDGQGFPFNLSSIEGEDYGGGKVDQGIYLTREQYEQLVELLQ